MERHLSHSKASVDWQVKVDKERIKNDGKLYKKELTSRTTDASELREQYLDWLSDCSRLFKGNLFVCWFFRV